MGTPDHHRAATCSVPCGRAPTGAAAEPDPHVPRDLHARRAAAPRSAQRLHCGRRLRDGLLVRPFAGREGRDPARRHRGRRRHRLVGSAQAAGGTAETFSALFAVMVLLDFLAARAGGLAGLDAPTTTWPAGSGRRCWSVRPRHTPGPGSGSSATSSSPDARRTRPAVDGRPRLHPVAGADQLVTLVVGVATLAVTAVAAVSRCGSPRC